MSELLKFLVEKRPLARRLQRILAELKVYAEDLSSDVEVIKSIKNMRISELRGLATKRPEALERKESLRYVS